MLCLAIESTAHTFGVAVVRHENETYTILANARKAFTTESGGMVPSKVSDHHAEYGPLVLAQALHDAACSIEAIDLIAFSQGPGLGGCLRVGAALARSLAVRYNKPLVCVNHCVAHLEVGRVLAKQETRTTTFDDPILLYASGANTQVIGYESGKYRVFGETLDIGVGNFLDQVARSLDLGFPGGPKIELLAKEGSYYPLPYTVKGMDVAFGGLLTRVKADIQTRKEPRDICASVQETAFAMLTEVAERALAHTGKSALVLGGGVACNARLQQMCAQMCAQRGAHCYVPAREFLIDNAAMIALSALLQYGAHPDNDLARATILPHQRTDEVVVTWR